MTRNLHSLFNDPVARDEMRDDWLICVQAIVVDVDDPEQMHRIRVLIPDIDESETHDEWVTALVPFVGSEGYGPVHLPEIGTEVLLFGRLGQKHSLFYLSRFNEDFQTPQEFADGSRGVKTDSPLRLIARDLVQLKSETADAAVEAANETYLAAGGSKGVRVTPGKFGVLGSLGRGRVTLPQPATNLPTCIALANALRQALIDFGFAQ